MKLRFTCLRRPLFLTLLLAFHSSSFTEATDRILTSVDPPRGNCRIDQLSPTDRRLSVSCRFSGLASHRSVLRFADQFAGVDRLSERIFALRMKDETGANVQLEIKGGGCYVFHNPKRAASISITYEMRLGRALDPSQSALTSSLSPEAGFLMLGDLIPRICSDEAGDCAPDPLSLQIVPPPGWTIATNEKWTEGAFEIASPQRAIFFLGRLRERVLAAGPMNIRIAVAGTWDFTDDSVFRLAQAVATEQAAIIDGAETGDFLVTLAPFPLPLTGLRSSAVTIGRTVVLQLNANQNPAQTFAHFRRHLAHEMFHFYLPNAFRIRENFDWFWEGFSRYLALLTLTRLQLIGLNDYLDAIGEEYAAYAFNSSRTQISLIGASPEKFVNRASSDLVYRKGMLVAALYDLELRRQSRGKLSVVDVARGLYQNYARRDLEVGNREVLSELGRWGDFTRLIRDDIEGAREIDLAKRVKPYGLLADWGPSAGGRVKIRRAPGISGKERELLDQVARD